MADEKVLIKIQLENKEQKKATNLFMIPIKILIRSFINFYYTI